jgi:antitoxin (DNA-binding transcriptional repressor) of toxin-antitoxin stability system
MKSISMLEFRNQAEEVLNQVQQGVAFVLTYRGKAVARLEPILQEKVPEDDPIFDLPKLANSSAAPLTNEAIDQIVYGQ